MWPNTLSGRLLITVLVGHYPTNKLIRRSPLIRQAASKGPAPLTPAPVEAVVSSSITIGFPKLSWSSWCINYVLLTLSPVYSPEGFLPRLACLNPAASVRSEPGSNSSKVFDSNYFIYLFAWLIMTSAHQTIISNEIIFLMNLHSFHYCFFIVKERPRPFPEELKTCCFLVCGARTM